MIRPAGPSFRRATRRCRARPHRRRCRTGAAQRPHRCTAPRPPPHRAPCQVAPKLHSDAEPVEFADLPVDQRSVRPGHAGDTAELLAALDDRRRGRGSPRPGRSPGRRGRRRPPRPRGVARRRVPVGVLGLATARRFADARHDRVAGVAHLARLVAADARPDPIGLVPRTLATRSGSAIWARVISTPSQRPGRRSRRAPTRPGRRRRSTLAGSPGRRPPLAPCGTRRR